MPEEINRIVTDAITNWFFTTSEFANANLRKAGVGGERIFFVGNAMIDTLMANMDRLRPPAFWAELGLAPGEYFVMTLHRPANVDQVDKLRGLLDAIESGEDCPCCSRCIHGRPRRWQRWLICRRRCNWWSRSRIWSSIIS
jgi:UDP-N-acetylglucosamine 2-epimerase (non-hydrolysing)